MTSHNQKPSPVAENLDHGEPTVPQVEHLFKNIFEVYEKLKALGFTYYDGKVTIIDTIEEKKL